ncbi:hypothetical protein IAT40_000885 [Kwoniella sp. CBS 6097]
MYAMADHESHDNARSESSAVIESSASVSIAEEVVHGMFKVGDCWVRSNDGVLFIVYRDILTAQSPVFRGMLELPQPHDSALKAGLKTVDVVPNSSGEAKPGFELQASSNVLEDLFALLYVPSHADIHAGFEDTKALMVLCEMLECSDSVLQAIIQRFEAVATEDNAWDLFIWASDKNDRNLGGTALQLMDADTFTAGAKTVLNWRSFRSGIGRLRPDWQCRLFQLCFSEPHKGKVLRQIPLPQHLWRKREPHYEQRWFEETVLPFQGDWSYVAGRFSKGDW